MAERRFVAAALAAIFLISCAALGQSAGMSPSSTPNETPSALPAIPAGTGRPEDRGEPVGPSATLAPPAALPTIGVEQRSLGDDGPWLLLVSKGPVYAFNADGTGQTQLLGDDIISMSVAPGGGWLSYVTDAVPEDESTGLELRLFDLSGRSARLVTSLQNPSVMPQTEGGDYDPSEFESMRAITMGAPRWSHAGDRIAFIGQLDGPSADLYVFELDTGVITQLSDGPSHAYNPIWSPDDAYIFHNGVWNFGTGAGFNNAGSWAARSDGSAMVETTAGMGTDSVVQWVGPRSFLMASWSQPCGQGGLQLIDLGAGSITMIWAYAFEDFAYSQETGQMVLMVPPDWGDCTDGGQPTGVFLYDRPLGEPVRVSNEEFWSVRLDPTDGASFLLQDWEARMYRLSPAGDIDHVADMPARSPQYSGEAERWAWYQIRGDDPGLWVGPLAAPGPERVFDGPVRTGIWSPDGAAFFFLADEGDAVYMAEAPVFVPVLISNTADLEFFPYFQWVDP
jgi:hypothetical protein